MRMYNMHMYFLYMPGPCTAQRNNTTNNLCVVLVVMFASCWSHVLYQERATIHVFCSRREGAKRNEKDLFQGLPA